MPDRRCAFGADGKFKPDNRWCATMHLLDACSAHLEGDELQLAVFEGHDGSFCYLVRRIGDPDRVRMAWRVTPEFQAVHLTQDYVEELLAGGKRGS